MRRFLVFGSLFLVQAGAVAHHSAVGFDVSKTFAFKGTLTRVDWRNPHVVISVAVTGEGSTPETWEFESGAPSWFRGRNLTKTDIDDAIGQEVAVGGVRARDGSHHGYLYELTFADARRWELR